MNELPLKKHGFIIYDNPKEIQEKATHYGQMRTEANAKLHEVAPEYDRGDLAVAVDELGIIAELIAIEFLNQQKIVFTALDVFEEKPVKTADVFISESKIDVKGVSAITELRVNRKAHYQKDVTHYWFIKPQRNENGELTGVAEYWIVTAAYVTYWKSRTSRTEYFYKDIEEINNLFKNEE